MKSTLAASILLTYALGAASFSLAQGPLTPPGAPAPTMKTLDEVQPRIAINSINTPGDADSIYKITQPGSYYLTGNITGVAGGKNGIEIAANDVTIDLMGYEIFSGVGSVRAIQATVNNSINIAIRNGAIRNWNIGIDVSVSDYVRLSDLRILGYSHGGILGRLATTITNCTISSGGDNGILVTDLAVITGCTMQSNGQNGISAGLAAVITNCNTRFNGASGITISSGGSVTNTTCTQNTGKGMVVGDGCTISDCAAYSNNGDGFTIGKACTVRHCSSSANVGNGDGFEIGDGTAVLDCTSYSNAGNGILGTNASATISGCTVYKNAGAGISIAEGVVTRCESSGNSSDGIHVVRACRITENKCYSNGPGGFFGAGIRVTQNDCDIQNNTVAFNDIGIDVDSFPSAVIHNSARANLTANYEVAAGNFLGTIITTTANMNAATNTYGNLSF